MTRGKEGPDVADVEAIRRRVSERQHLRFQEKSALIRDFSASDQLRAELNELGVCVADDWGYFMYTLHGRPQCEPLLPRFG